MRALLGTLFNGPLHEIIEVAFPANPAAERENGCRFMVRVQANGIVPPHDLMMVIVNQFMHLIGVLFANPAVFNRNAQVGLMHGIGIHIDHEQEHVRVAAPFFP